MYRCLNAIPNFTWFSKAVMQRAAMEKHVWILKRNTSIAYISVVPIYIHTRLTNQYHTTMYNSRVPRDLPTCICVSGICVILNTYMCLLYVDRF